MFNSNTAIFEWMPSKSEHNFGDHLMQLIGERIFTKSEWHRIKNTKDEKFVLIGSFIGDHTIRTSLIECDRVHLVGCGYRGEPIPTEFGGRASFIGCRGFHSSKALQESGIVAPPIGDSAMVLPLIVGRRKNCNNNTVFVPHINDGDRFNYTPEAIGCDEIIQPTTQDTTDLITIIRKISSSQFVLAGAMHAAIVAHAYGVPFAFFQGNNGHIDCPPKWADWLSSVSAPQVSPCFVSNMHDGYAWWQSVQAQLFQNRFIPLVKAFSVLGTIRPAVRVKAAILDSIGLRQSRKLAPYLAHFKEKINSNKELWLSIDGDDVFAKDYVDKQADSQIGLQIMAKNHIRQVENYAELIKECATAELALKEANEKLFQQSAEIESLRGKNQHYIEIALRAEAQIELIKDLFLISGELEQL
jgi:hypothetical protein